MAPIRIAVKTFESPGVITSDEAIFLTDVAQSELIWNEKFVVVDHTRTKQALDSLRISQDSCSSVECIVKIGQQLNVQKVLSGTISKIGQAFAVSIQVVDVESGRIQAIKNANYEGDVSGLNPTITDLVKQVTSDLPERIIEVKESESRSIFDKPDFSSGQFSIDAILFGSDYVQNDYSHNSLSPILLSVSYILMSQYFVTASFCLLNGDYVLNQPETPALTGLLNGRTALWGESMNSLGIGLGGGYRIWRLRGGAGFIFFISKDTDLSPSAAVELHAEYYVLRFAYIGLATIMFNGAGLIAPDRVGPQVPAEDVGITRRDFPGPVVITLKIGVDL
jgi:TolB-like protein